MEKKLLVEGMMCNHCKATVEKALSGVPGVTAATVDLEAKTATVTLSGDVADAALFDAVKAKGFTPVKVL
ncbi:MAG: heavy-metal-associated domain-containing protein [Christensenellaceae bacterium]|nr:heavy-metal-associated domain-containing protein [Christensenellaceae bacterium]